jgi:hypothetical protein
LTDDIEQLFELTRIIILVIAGLVPGLSETPVSSLLETSEEAIALVRASLEALVDVSDVFPSIIKTDLQASILHIFVTIFATGACQSALVPQALPIFRRLISSIADDQRPDTKQHVQNTLKRMLVILGNARKVESAASLACEKNIMLACTLLVSAAQPVLDADEALTAYFLTVLREAIAAPTTTKVATGCFRTLLLQGVTTRRTFAHSISFLQDAGTDGVFDDSKTSLAQALTTFASKLSAEQRSVAISLLVSILLHRAAIDGENTYQDIATRLLELAAVDNATFRILVAGMDHTRKGLLENVLRSQASKRGGKQDAATGQPSIQLKMNF